MPVCYSAVARDTVVLAEAHATTHGRDAADGLDRASRPRGARRRTRNARASYGESDLVFLEGRLDLFLCAAGEGDGKRLPFAFLEDVGREFVLKHGLEVRSAEYLPWRSTPTHRSGEQDVGLLSGKAGRAGEVQGELDEVKTVMLENIERVLERGDKIELP